MPIDDKNIEPQAIANYIVSRNILDKLTVNNKSQYEVSQVFSPHSYHSSSRFNNT